MSDERMIRADNLKLLMKHHGLNKAEVSRQLGTSDSYVSKLLSGRPGTFGEKAARRIEEKFGTPRFWLDTPHSEDTPPALSLTQSEEPAQAHVGVDFVFAPSLGNVFPVITWEQLPMLNDNNQGASESRETMPSDYSTTTPAKWVELRSSDRSLSERFPPGTMFLIEPTSPDHHPESGQLVLVKIEDAEYAIRRYKHVSPQRFIAEPLNPEYATLDTASVKIEVHGFVRRAILKL